MSQVGNARADAPTATPAPTDFVVSFNATTGSPSKATIKTFVAEPSIAGTFTCNGATNVTVNATVAAGDEVVITLNTANGTVGAIPTVKVKNASNIVVAGTANDTSVYNYRVWSF